MLFLLSIACKLFSFVSPYLVYVPFEIAVLEQPCNYVLLKGGHGAGIKAEAVFKFTDKPLRQNHISDTQGGGNGFGKGVQVYYVILIGKRKQRVLRLCGNGKLGFKIILDNVSVARVRPADVFVPFACRCRNARGIASVRRGVNDVRGRL